MFQWLKKLAQPKPFMPEDSFRFAGGPGVAAPLPVEPAQLEKSPKPSLKQRILEGLPGFVGSAGSVMAAKAAAATCAKGLCVGASPLAMAAAGVLGAAAVGGVTAQTVNYVRDRWTQAEADRGEKIRARDLVKDFSLAAAKRELGAFYENGLKSRDFWKGAAIKGGISAAAGAAFGGLASSETVRGLAGKAVDYVSQIKPLSVLDKVVTALSGSGAAQAAEAFKAAANSDVATTAGQALATTAAVAPAALDQLKTLVEAKGTPSTALTKMIGRAASGNMQALKDLAMGAWNGKLGVPMNKELARELYKVAAAGGNAQAVRDLAWIDSLKGSGISAPAPAAASLPAAIPATPAALADAAPAAQPAPPLTINDGVAAAGSIDEMAPVILTPPELTKPARDGGVASICKVFARMADGALSAVTSCRETVSDMIQPGQKIVVQHAESDLQRNYFWRGEEATDIHAFRQDVLTDFLRNKLPSALARN